MAVFQSLSDRLQDTFAQLKGKGRLTEDDINAAMRQIRMALLEADVNYRVVKRFVAVCKEKCLTSEVMDSLTPAQNVVKIVLDELTELLGSTESKMTLAQNRTPNVIMLVGLQGSGKTTAAAKLAYLLKGQGRNPLLAACDVHRPAAADQLATLGDEIGVPVYRGDGRDAVRIARESIQNAVDRLCDIVIVDTAGRLQIDEEMMAEAVDIKNAVKPDQILMVVDAMGGQDIVNVVTTFAERVDFDGVIMSKLDGDARGGGALSVREVTGKPIKFVSMGEKPDSLEVFHPDRMAKRILGMGDVIGIIEQAQKIADQESIEAAERMLRSGFTMDDLLAQMQQIRKMGGLGKLLAMIPGAERALAQQGGNVDEEQMVRIEQVIIERTERRHEAHEHLLQVVFSDPLHSAEDIKRLYRCDVISVAGLIVDVLLCHRQQSRNPVRLQNTRLPFRSRLSLFVCFQNHVAVIEITSVLSVVHVSASMPFLRCVWP